MAWHGTRIPDDLSSPRNCFHPSLAVVASLSSLPSLQVLTNGTIGVQIQTPRCPSEMTMTLASSGRKGAVLSRHADLRNPHWVSPPNQNTEHISCSAHIRVDKRRLSSIYWADRDHRAREGHLACDRSFDRECQRTIPSMLVLRTRSWESKRYRCSCRSQFSI